MGNLLREERISVNYCLHGTLIWKEIFNKIELILSLKINFSGRITTSPRYCGVLIQGALVCEVAHIFGTILVEDLHLEIPFFQPKRQFRITFVF